MTHKIIESVSKSESNNPVAIQCLWRSDYDNIWLDIDLIYENNGSYEKNTVNVLTYRRFKSKEDLVQKAHIICKEYLELYDIELYFPSPDEWARNCPNWWESNTALKCEDCKTPITPIDSEYLPKEVCYPCHIKREQNIRIKKASPCNGTLVYLVRDGEYDNIGFCLYFNSFLMQFISDIPNESKPTNSIKVATIQKSENINIVKKLNDAIEEELKVYEKPKKKRFRSTRKVLFKNREIELTRFNKNHEYLSRMLSNYQIAQRALNGGYGYKIYFKDGITYRDDSILRFVNYKSNGKTTKNNLVEEYKNILTEHELFETLENLITKECLTTNNSEYYITELGSKIL